MPNVIITTQPQSVFVDEGNSSVTFTTSGTTFGTILSSNPVTYRWYTQDSEGGGFTFIPGATSNELTLSPVAAYDNDTFRAGLSAVGVDSEEFTETVSFFIRLSGDPYKDWEVAGESGSNRVRRLALLGYL